VPVQPLVIPPRAGGPTHDIDIHGTSPHHGPRPDVQAGNAEGRLDARQNKKFIIQLLALKVIFLVTIAEVMKIQV